MSKGCFVSDGLCVMSEGKVRFRFKITWFWVESLVLTWKFDVCDDECAVMHLFFRVLGNGE